MTRIVNQQEAFWVGGLASEVWVAWRKVERVVVRAVRADWVSGSGGEGEGEPEVEVEVLVERKVAAREAMGCEGEWIGP